MLTETASTAIPSTFGHRLLRPRVSVLYIAVTLCLTAGGFVLGIYGQGGFSLIAFWIGFALTGPLGVVAAIFAGVPVGRAIAGNLGSLGSPPNILDVSVFPGLLVLFFSAALVVVVNVLIVRRWVYATRTSIDKGEPEPIRRAIDRLMGSCFFIYSGAAFVLLCLFAAFGSIVGTASDEVSPQAASTGHTVILISFLIGFASAGAGLVLWILFTKKRRPILRPAVVDFVIVAGAFVAVVVSVAT